MVTQELEIVVQVTKPTALRATHKAIGALFPHVVDCLERGGYPEMVDAFARATRVLNSRDLIWSHVEPFVTKLFNKPSAPSLHRTITLASPHVPWSNMPHGESVVERWAAAASATPYTEGVQGRSVVDALLHIASVDRLLPHIPIHVWAWLKELPSLPPQCSGRSKGSKKPMVRRVRALGDVEVLKAYLLLIWSEWDCVSTSGWDYIASAQQHILTR